MDQSTKLTYTIFLQTAYIILRKSNGQYVQNYDLYPVISSFFKICHCSSFNWYQFSIDIIRYSLSFTTSYENILVHVESSFAVAFYPGVYFQHLRIFDDMERQTNAENKRTGRVVKFKNAKRHVRNTRVF